MTIVSFVILTPLTASTKDFFATGGGFAFSADSGSGRFLPSEWVESVSDSDKTAGFGFWKLVEFEIDLEVEVEVEVDAEVTCVDPEVDCCGFDLELSEFCDLEPWFLSEFEDFA